MINKSRETVETITRDIEDLIDSNSLSGILDLIATVCHEKAEWLESRWQSPSQAKAWTKAARQIEKIVSTMDI